MDNNKISQGISFDVSNYLIKRLKILVKSRKTFETWWIIVDEEEDTNERKMRREKEEEEEEKGKRGIFGIGLAGREAEEIGKRRWWPHVKSSCCPVSRRPGKVGVHLAWQLLETVRYLVRQHLFGLRAAWTFENCP